MKLKVLAENTRRDDSLKAEHGLSLYIETQKHKILYDFGQSTIFAENAKVLNVDLREVDIAILSHSHYDHGGGMECFMELNDHAPIYVNRHVWERHYSGEKDISIDPNLRGNPRIIEVGDGFKIDEELSLYTCSNFEPIAAIDTAGLFAFEQGEMVPEDFRHEQYLVIKENGKRIVVSGCSHKGVMNITSYLRPDIFIGGFHFSKIVIDAQGEKRLENSALFLQASGADYYTCHCTGQKQAEYMQKIMGDKLKILSGGDEFEVR